MAAGETKAAWRFKIRNEEFWPRTVDSASHIIIGFIITCRIYRCDLMPVKPPSDSNKVELCGKINGPLTF